MDKDTVLLVGALVLAYLWLNRDTKPAGDTKTVVVAAPPAAPGSSSAGETIEQTAIREGGKFACHAITAWLNYCKQEKAKAATGRK